MKLAGMVVGIIGAAFTGIATLLTLGYGIFFLNLLILGLIIFFLYKVQTKGNVFAIGILTIGALLFIISGAAGTISLDGILYLVSASLIMFDRSELLGD